MQLVKSCGIALCFYGLSWSGYKIFPNKVDPLEVNPLLVSCVDWFHWVDIKTCVSPCLCALISCVQVIMDTLFVGWEEVERVGWYF